MQDTSIGFGHMVHPQGDDAARRQEEHLATLARRRPADKSATAIRRALDAVVADTIIGTARVESFQDRMGRMMRDGASVPDIRKVRGDLDAAQIELDSLHLQSASLDASLTVAEDREAEELRDLAAKVTTAQSTVAKFRKFIGTDYPALAAKVAAGLAMEREAEDGHGCAARRRGLSARPRRARGVATGAERAGAGGIPVPGLPAGDEPGASDGLMLSFSVKVDTREAQKLLKSVQKQINFANVLALNRVAKLIKDKEQEGILTTFRNPRPFTVNSIGITPATIGRPTATIFIKDRTANYLGAYEHGGSHYVPNRPELGRVLLEPVHAKTDAYGQMTKAYVAAMFANPRVFVAIVHDILGVWLRPPAGERRDGTKGTKGKLTLAPGGTGRTGLVLLAKVVPNRPVSKHLNFELRGMATFLDAYPAAFDTAFAKAMATAK